MVPRIMPETLETLVSRLERTADELRSGELEPRQAAALVDDLARLAAEAGSELDRRVRSGDQPLGPAGQLALGS
jgi:polyhydroxyalkanoate synthesis regulator phasin